MRLHLVGLPHTETTSDYLTCAYTQKIVKFGRMMTDAGHELVIYAGERNEAPCAEHVQLISRAEQRAFYGPALEEKNTTWGHAVWNADAPPWRLMNQRAIAEIDLRAGPRDIVLLSVGVSQRPIADALGRLVIAEPFVGYEGPILGPTLLGSVHHAYESTAWRHAIYGKHGIGMTNGDGLLYDTVIPNYFDAGEFALEPKDEPPYLLYVGRLIRRKGILVARELAAATGMRLKVAGPGVQSYRYNNLRTLDGCELLRVDYMGVLDAPARAHAMARAAAVLVPTLYLEPFGGVAVEAMLSGTPVVSTDFGGFVDTVEPGVTGYRFGTLAEGVRAVHAALKLDSETIRARALERYSLEAVAPQFTAWLDRLLGLYGEGWADLTTERFLTSERDLEDAELVERANALLARVA